MKRGILLVLILLVSLSSVSALTFIDISYLFNKILSNLDISGKVVTSNPDLDVTFIERTPRYERYNVQYIHPTESISLPNGISNPGKKYPDPGELVTFKVHIKNKGSASSSSFNYQWKINNQIVNTGTITSLNVGEEKTVSYQWPWETDNNDYVEFIADYDNQINEEFEQNNNLKDKISAPYLRIHIEQSVYNTFNSLLNLKGTKSFEDWIQAYISEMNRLLETGGTNERMRIDQIVLETDGTLPRGGKHSPENLEWDGSWGFETTEWTSTTINSWVNQIQYSLLHELGHQIGLIDNYNLNYDWNYVSDNEIIPLCSSCNTLLSQCGDPTTYQGCTYYSQKIQDLMGPVSQTVSEFTAKALEKNLGKRRGYFGEYLFDTPTNSYLRIVVAGVPVANVNVDIYQSRSRSIKFSDLIFSGTTDTNGIIQLPNRIVSSIPITQTGHQLRSNPFGDIDIVGTNGILALRIYDNARVAYEYSDISEFNLQYWNGNINSATYDINVNFVTRNICVLGQIISCGVSDIGACQLGTQTCGSDGFYGACVNNINPSNEICNGIDDNCDSIIDNDCSITTTTSTTTTLPPTSTTTILPTTTTTTFTTSTTALTTSTSTTTSTTSTTTSSSTSTSTVPIILTCLEQNGDICNSEEYCPGNELRASDTNRCCSVTCEIASWSLCLDCGNGLLNLCDRQECSTIAEGCYFISNGIFGGNCYSCSGATCESYNGDQITCLDNACSISNCDWDSDLVSCIGVSTTTSTSTTLSTSTTVLTISTTLPIVISTTTSSSTSSTTLLPAVITSTTTSSTTASPSPSVDTGSGGSGSSRQKLFSKIKANENVKFSIASGTSVNELELKIKEDRKKVNIKINKLYNLPSDIGQIPKEEAYEYFEINSGLEENLFLDSKIRFKIDNSWIKARNYNKEEVTLKKYKNKKWIVLSTRFTGSDNKYSYFEAKSNGFSIFVITVEKQEPQRVVNLCGNGMIDAGENCKSCSSDVRCQSDEICNNSGICQKRTQQIQQPIQQIEQLPINIQETTPKIKATDLLLKNDITVLIVGISILILLIATIIIYLFATKKQKYREIEPWKKVSKSKKNDYEKLKKLAEDFKSKGYTMKQIKRSALESAWPESLIDEVLKRLK